MLVCTHQGARISMRFAMFWPTIRALFLKFVTFGAGSME